MRMWKNSLFYCTTNEIVIGNLNRTGWPPLIQEMARYWLALNILTEVSTMISRERRHVTQQDDYGLIPRNNMNESEHNRQFGGASYTG